MYFIFFTGKGDHLIYEMMLNLEKYTKLYTFIPSRIHTFQAGSRLVAYLRIISVWTVSRVIIPLQNFDTVIRNGFFAHLAVFPITSKRQQAVQWRQSGHAYIASRCCFSAPDFLLPLFNMGTDTDTHG
jgi:hypothetical protein